MKEEKKINKEEKKINKEEKKINKENNSSKKKYISGEKEPIQSSTIDESIDIISLHEYYDELIPKRKGTNGIPGVMNNIRAIILYQNSFVNEDIVNKQLARLNSENRSYHFSIDTNGVIFQLNPVDRTVPHCSTVEYTKTANEYFGDNICPVFKASAATPHYGSPNSCSVAINLPRVNGDGNINEKVLKSLIKLCSYIINKYAPSLQAQANILCNFKINANANKDPVVFFNDQDFYHKFKYDVEVKRTHWLRNYKGAARGYPTEKIEFYKLPE